jgi:predicted Zn-dependent peptidase
VKDKKLFSNIECYHLGSHDSGLLSIEGKIVKGVDIRRAEEAVDEEIGKMTASAVDAKELEKVKNKTESMMAFEDMNVMNRASSLAYYELLGDAGMIDTELERYRAVTAEAILEECRNVFREENSSTLYYLADGRS